MMTPLCRKKRDPSLPTVNVWCLSVRPPIWEIRIKEALGKLQVPRNFREVLGGQSFEMLDITAHHAHAVGGLCDHHRDPFDRMLVAQAKIEGLSLITRDRHLKRYDIAIVEA